MKPVIGGQAVIEGVMIRSGDYYITSVRKPDGTITYLEKKIENSEFIKKIKKILFIGGIYFLYETFKIGIETLNYSAEASSQENEKITKKEMIISFSIAFILAIGIFVILPYYLTDLLKLRSSFVFNLVDGIIKIVFLTLYIFAISLFKDVRRVFEYHGAEHKVVNTYERERKLDLDNIKSSSTLHLRCGTNFLFLVMAVSIIFFMMIPSSLPTITKIILRIILIPLIASASFEIIRLFNKFPNNIFLKILVSPGLLLQYITTKQPDEMQIEVALHSLNRVLMLIENK